MSCRTCRVAGCASPKSMSHTTRRSFIGKPITSRKQNERNVRGTRHRYIQPERSAVWRGQHNTRKRKARSDKTARSAHLPQRAHPHSRRSAPSISSPEPRAALTAANTLTASSSVFVMLIPNARDVPTSFRPLKFFFSSSEATTKELDMGQYDTTRVIKRTYKFRFFRFCCARPTWSL
jgi:hypothetical protein